MFKVHLPEDIRDVIGAKAVLVAPIPPELAPPIESVDSIELGWPWKLGAIALLIAGFATVGFMLYA